MGPRPAAISINEAHTSSGTARSAFSSIRVGTRQSARACVRAAGSASSSPNSAASSVPRADIASVSAVACATLRTNGGEVSGGKNSPANRAIAASESRDHRSRHCKSRLQKLATTSAASASSTQAVRERSAISRGGRSPIGGRTFGSRLIAAARATMR